MHACVCGTHGGQKRLSDPVEPQLQETALTRVGAGNPTWVLCKGGKHFLTTVPSPQPLTPFIINIKEICGYRTFKTPSFDCIYIGITSFSWQL